MSNNRKETFKSLIKAFKYGQIKKSSLIFYILIVFLIAGFSIVIPILSAKTIVNITKGLYQDVIIIVIAIFGVEIIANIAQYSSRFFIRGTNFNITNALQLKVATETLKFTGEELDKNSSGILLERLQGDSREISNVFSDLISEGMLIIRNIGIFIAIFIISKWAFLFSIISLIILYMFEKLRIEKFFESKKIVREKNEKNSGMLAETIRGIRDIKLLNAEDNYLNNLDNSLTEINKLNHKMDKTNSNYLLLSWSITDFTTLLFNLLCLFLVIKGDITVASFLILRNYLPRAQQIRYSIVTSMEKLKNFNQAAERVFEIIENGFNKEKFGKEKLITFSNNIEFKNVSFGYKQSKNVLNNVTFTIKKNQTVAFIGKSGSGKSTITNLLVKFYEIDSGEILIDGHNLNNLTKNSIRDNISLVSQSPYIFNLSIKENLKIVKPNLTDKEMIKVCQIAHIHDFITSLPQQYETIVGEGGVTLSGGQKQRLAIARTLLKDSPIIIFDEATSALDNQTQSNITDAIKTMKGNYTIIIIAHRLTTIIDSDHIFMIDQGNIIASGNHQQLINNNPNYRKLYNKEL